MGSTTDGSDNVAQAAWLRYQEGVAERRARLLAHDAAQDPWMRAQGLYFLQGMEVAAFNLYVAPRQQYPALYIQSIFMPLELSWGMPNPDFLNHNGFIDGAHSYRIWGKKNGIDWATIQVFRGFWGDETMGNLGNIDFDDVPTAADGSFEIFLAPNPPEKPDGRYWFKLDPAVRNSMLAMRETFYDWTAKPMEIHIETLDRDADAPIYFDEDELAARTDKAAKFAAACFESALDGARKLSGDRNVFAENLNARQGGGSPLGHWVSMLYDVGADEALILEMPVVEARYWGIQLGSVWGQTTDYSYHQSSINGAQAHIDSDGRFRAVLALSDPGVPNWLDPAGLPIGRASLRFYKTEHEIAVPTVVKVPLQDVRKHLPADTPVVMPERRRADMQLRTRAALGRNGQ